MSDKPNNKDHWFRDMFAYGPWTGVPILILLGIIIAIGSLLLTLTGKHNEVIVYTSQDQEYAEPIFNNFTKQTGIKVRPVYDNEAAKTVGLVNRLIAEKNNPQCDVFWNNEELRTRQLAHDNIISNKWETFGYRTRCIVVNTNQLPVAKAPHDCYALTEKRFFGKVALAYPLFGTTSTHFLVLRQRDTDVVWKEWCRELAADKPFVVDGNSVVVKMVGRGEAWVGLTDSDDIRAGQREGLPVAEIGLTQGRDGLRIPNTAAIVVKAPHPSSAQALLKYLGSPEVHRALEQAGALTCHGFVGTTYLGEGVPDSDINWNDLLANQNQNLDFLKGLFLR